MCISVLDYVLDFTYFAGDARGRSDVRFSFPIVCSERNATHQHNVHNVLNISVLYRHISSHHSMEPNLSAIDIDGD